MKRLEFVFGYSVIFTKNVKGRCSSILCENLFLSDEWDWCHRAYRGRSVQVCSVDGEHGSCVRLQDHSQGKSFHSVPLHQMPFQGACLSICIHINACWKIKAAIFSHQPDCTCVWSAGFEHFNDFYNTECPYWDQVSLISFELNFSKVKCVWKIRKTLKSQVQ